MKDWQKYLWRWSWLLTLPITVVFVYWTWATLDRYYTFGVRYNSAPAKMTLLYAGELEGSHLLQSVRLAFSTRNNKEGKTDSLRTINLFVPESNLAKLDSNLPHSGLDEYVEGGLWDGKRLHKVKVRYRGDFLPHWGFFKKSLRIKTKKSSLFEGMRAFNINSPKGAFQLHDYLAYRLADYLKLLTPHSEMVQLTLNGKTQGLYLLLEQLEELTLRRHGRMPGDMYAGELIGKDSYAGVNQQVFDHPGLWKKISINNHYPESSHKPLELLAQLVNAPSSEEIQDQLSNLLDLEAWARFSAFETLAQTFHYDETHNWRLYYDPMLSKFEPIIWDPIAWVEWPTGSGKDISFEVIRTKLHKALFKNADFLRIRQNVLEEFFKSGLDKKFLSETDQVIAAIKPVIANDPNLHYSQKRIESRMRERRLHIEEVFEDVQEQLLLPPGQVSFSLNPEGVNFLITGRRPVNRTFLIYEQPLKGDITATLNYWENGRKIEKDVTGGLNVRGVRLELDIPLISGMKIKEEESVFQNHLEILPGYYELKISGVPIENKLYEILVDRGGDQQEHANLEKSIQRYSFNDLYEIVHSQPLKIATRWKGDIEVAGVQEIFSELIIEPGTTLHMKPGATIILHNRLLAEGTAEKPIRFLPASEGQEPWGALVLKGSGANSSRISYSEFAGGSGLKGDLFEYTAMLSVHDVDGVEVNNCLFRDSHLTDDMVHVVYSQVHVSNSRFERALMDALDIDISDAVIQSCYFVDSGNDSVDLMTSNVIITDTTIENAGDKAASVGEGARLLAINNIFRNNVIGVQAKDGSVASLYNLDLTDNGHALDAYKKNWRYANGGKIYLYKSRVIGNKKMITADKKSKIFVYDSYIDKPIESTPKRISLADSVDTGDATKAKEKKLHRNKKEVEYLKNFDSRFWERIDPARRGALNVASH
ncbi:MAG: CotH kinase family protein [Desulfocapsaceae bacterium]|nr:CotH kinase family protein [Desulfocapsaceae bacterium]